jgi:hypothetical protein
MTFAITGMLYTLDNRYFTFKQDDMNREREKWLLSMLNRDINLFFPQPDQASTSPSIIDLTHTVFHSSDAAAVADKYDTFVEDLSTDSDDEA